jgi:hypothetical protein
LLYPELPAGVWVTAMSAAWVVIGSVFGRSREWPGQCARILPDEHFVFRDGAGRHAGWFGPLSRADDPDQLEETTWRGRASARRDCCCG